MTHERFISVKFSLLLGLIFLCSPIGARELQHFLGVSLAGVEANIIGENLKSQVGGGGQALFNYEFAYKAFFVNVGVGADYQLTQGKLMSFIESKQMTDISGEPMEYQYRFEQYQEKQTILYGMFQILLGTKLSPNFYLQAGTHIRCAINKTYTTQANLCTTGAYSRWAGEFIANVPSYGFYPSDSYHGGGDIRDLRVTIAPIVEFGYLVPLSRKADLRIALFGEYAFPMNNEQSLSIVDYSQVNMDVRTWSQADLQRNLKFHSVLDSSILPSWGNLEIGVKVSFLFDVTNYKVPCHCMNE